MRRSWPVIRAVVYLALWPLIIIFSPVVLLAGEPVNRYVMRRVHRSASTAQVAVAAHGGRPARAAAVRLPLRTSLLLTVISNPLWIAKNRLHIDIHVSGGRTVLEGRSVPLATRRERVDAEARRLVDLGATLTVVMSQDGVDAYAVGMKDPEGNEFDIN